MTSPPVFLRGTGLALTPLEPADAAALAASWLQREAEVVFAVRGRSLLGAVGLCDVEWAAGRAVARVVFLESAGEAERAEAVARLRAYARDELNLHEVALDATRRRAF